MIFWYRFMGESFSGVKMTFLLPSRAPVAASQKPARLWHNPPHFLRYRIRRSLAPFSPDTRHQKVDGTIELDWLTGIWSAHVTVFKNAGENIDGCHLISFPSAMIFKTSHKSSAAREIRLYASLAESQSSLSETSMITKRSKPSPHFSRSFSVALGSHR
uniref:Uncharacterized protein n=1 Tax=mine drainage metagenome TaxID=410659 RepID=E6QVR7_9ZZZZ